MKTLFYFSIICLIFATCIFKAIIKIHYIKFTSHVPYPVDLDPVDNSSNTTSFNDTPIVYATVLPADQLENNTHMDKFDCDSTAVVDSYANVHIWNSKDNMVGELRPFHLKQGVITIGGANHQPSGNAGVKVSWKDDDNKTYNIFLKDVLIFPSSPVKVISSNKLATQFSTKDGTPGEEGTWILSKHSYSTFN